MGRIRQWCKPREADLAQMRLTDCRDVAFLYQCSITSLTEKVSIPGSRRLKRWSLACVSGAIPVQSLIKDLGEVTRNMLLHLIDSCVLFNGYSSPILNTHYGYDASFVSNVEGAKEDREVKKMIINDLGVDPEHMTAGCVEIVRWACSMVARRAASLAACAIAAVVLHTGNDQTPEGEEETGVDVGLDGR